MKRILKKLRKVESDIRTIRSAHEERIWWHLLKWGSGRVRFQIDGLENRVYPLKVASHFYKLASGQMQYRSGHMKTVLLGRWSHTRLIPHLLFHVAAQCQNRCRNCAHTGLIVHDPSYQMSLESLERFLFVTAQSNYFVENLWLDGPGEPTLWRHFNEGIDALYRSPEIGGINISTNGQSLGAVADATWPKIDRIILSVYPSHAADGVDAVRQMCRRHRVVLEVRDMTLFRVRPSARHPGTLPAYCVCAGPMVYDDRVFYNCGPNGVDAALLKGENLFDDPEQCGPLKKNYLAGVPTSRLHGPYPYRKSAYAICEYCWANWNINLENVPHENTIESKSDQHNH